MSSRQTTRVAEPPGSAPFTRDEREAVYRCIHTRRDVRSQFLKDPIPDDVLIRILRAGHHAPSVGFMQPWDFVVIRDRTVKAAVHAAFLRADAEAAAMFDDPRQQAYKNLKLAGILEAPVGLCVTCDRSRHGPTVIGRTHQPNMDLYSAVCAVQTMWLAARAEDIGVGWVSIIRPDDLRAALGMPDEIEPIAYLCLGYVSHFLDQPELQRAGWLSRLKLSDVVSFDRWRRKDADDALLQKLDLMS